MLRMVLTVGKMLKHKIMTLKYDTIKLKGGLVTKSRFQFEKRCTKTRKTCKVSEKGFSFVPTCFGLLLTKKAFWLILPQFEFPFNVLQLKDNQLENTAEEGRCREPL